ncbi:hypothetical protein Lfu02_15140 [Longispora fulva]|uniref:Uncharacterized protein n=1 Tax=Longispora fulva TaxID=619741 RepID=A0A8J7GYE0_9ACTN|nr:hypothetical protein [Longispora fulva]MBG6140476.1 hypothetical protein [Longispora fulva]GIG57142.1 hypothetical protein Lfu02_15140 [Longispora fulva]
MTWFDDTFIDPDKRREAIALINEKGQDHLKYAGGDHGFGLFMLAIDYACRKRLGVSCFDLADYCYRDAYDDGLTPVQTLKLALAAEF